MTKTTHGLCYQELPTTINDLDDNIFSCQFNVILVGLMQGFSSSLDPMVGIFGFGIGHGKAIVSKCVKFTCEHFLKLVWMVHQIYLYYRIPKNYALYCNCENSINQLEGWPKYIALNTRMEYFLYIKMYRAGLLDPFDLCN